MRNSTRPTNSAGTIARFSRAYKAGARNAHSCHRITGEASTKPTRKPSLKTIMTGSVGLVTISFTPERLQAITCQRGLVRLGVLLHHALVGVLRLGGVLPPLGEEAQVVQRRGGAGRGGVLVDDLRVVPAGRIRAVRGEALADEVQRVGRARAVGIGPEQFPQS